jgi:hypothetical protein
MTCTHSEVSLRRIDRTVNALATEAMGLLDKQVQAHSNNEPGCYETDEETLQKLRALLFTIQIVSEDIGHE